MENNEFEMELDAKLNNLSKAEYFGNVLIRNVSRKKLGTILDLIANKPFVRLNTITLLLDSNYKVKDLVKSHYTLMDAAGGIVEKGNKILMIYRLRKWDLPKGKVEINETFEEAALREVEEECNIQVRLKSEICTSYHTYPLGNKDILKKTVWYSMKCLDDSKMKPAKGENIEEVRWMNHKELLHSLQESYRSLGYVMERYFKSKGQIA